MTGRSHERSRFNRDCFVNYPMPKGKGLQLNSPLPIGSLHVALGDKAGIASPTRVPVEPVDTSDQEVARRQGGSAFGTGSKSFAVRVDCPTKAKRRWYFLCANCLPRGCLSTL